MKKLYLIGNQKMNMSRDTLMPYFDGLVKLADLTENVVGVCVPSLYMELAKIKLSNSRVLFGAQNIYFKDSGAFTGEISAKMLTDFNANLVIVGHSERRTLFGETDSNVNEKIKKALEFGFTPIVCFGETLAERETGNEKQVVLNQISMALNDMNEDMVRKMIFAYEPVWAIGTGVNATSEQAEEIANLAKQIISEKYKLDHSDIVMLYGGSLKPSNAYDILSKPSIDGGLIGGACLKLEEFEQLINVRI